jgi:hypothetical protein
MPAPSSPQSSTRTVSDTTSPTETSAAPDPFQAVLYASSQLSIVDTLSKLVRTLSTTVSLCMPDTGTTATTAADSVRDAVARLVERQERTTAHVVRHIMDLYQSLGERDAELAQLRQERDALRERVAVLGECLAYGTHTHGSPSTVTAANTDDLYSAPGLQKSPRKHSGKRVNSQHSRTNLIPFEIVLEEYQEERVEL